MVESPHCHGNNQLEVQPEDMEDSCQNSQGKKKKVIWVGNLQETLPAESFCQLPLALAHKFLSEQTSCTHLLSAASVIHSKRIIVSGAQHM